MQAICNCLYIQEVKAAESLVVDIDVWECLTNSETALSVRLAVSADLQYTCSHSSHCCNELCLPASHRGDG